MIRGCTSRSTSRLARPPGVVHRDPTDPGPGHPDVPPPVEVAWLDLGTQARGEHKLGALPRDPRPGPGFGFALHPGLQRRDTDSGQRHRVVGRLGLRLPAKELPADPLKLEPNRQLAHRQGPRRPRPGREPHPYAGRARGSARRRRRADHDRSSPTRGNAVLPRSTTPCPGGGAPVAASPSLPRSWSPTPRRRRG